MAKDPLVMVEWRVNEQYRGGNYRTSCLRGLMMSLMSHNVDVIYLDDVQTTVKAWLSK